MSKKTKKPEVQLPADDAAANQVLRDYAEADREFAKIEIAMNVRLDAIRATYATQAAPWSVKRAVAEAKLTAYAAAHRQRLTDEGKTKTIKMDAGDLSWRQRPESVRWPQKFKSEDIVALIEGAIAAKREELRQKNTKDNRDDLAALESFIRVKREPNKEAMLEHDDLARTIPNVLVGSTGEDFFIEPFGAEITPKAEEAAVAI